MRSWHSKPRVANSAGVWQQGPRFPSLVCHARTLIFLSSPKAIQAEENWSQSIYYQENQNYVPRKHRLLLHLLLHNRMLIPDHNLLSRELFPKKPEIISSVWEILTRIKKGYLAAIVLGLRYVFILKCCIGVDRVSWMVPTRPREECVVCLSEIANCTTFHNEQDTLLFTQSEK